MKNKPCSWNRVTSRCSFSGKIIIWADNTIGGWKSHYSNINIYRYLIYRCSFDDIPHDIPMWKHHHQPPLLVSQPSTAALGFVTMPGCASNSLRISATSPPNEATQRSVPSQVPHSSAACRPAGTPGARLGSEPWKSDGKISESGDLIRENRDFQWEIYWKWPCRSWVNHLEIYGNLVFFPWLCQVTNGQP